MAWSLLLALGVLGCSRQLEPVERATRGIRAASIRDYGEALSADAMAGRRHASPEADSVVTYLTRELRRAGIVPRPSADGLLADVPASFEHYFDVTLSRLGARNGIVAACDGRTYRVGVGDGFLPLVYASEADVSGPSVRLERAAELWGDGKRLRGRIVRVAPTAYATERDDDLDAALYRVAQRLTQLGARAVLFEDVDDWERLASATYPDALSDAVRERLRGWRVREAHWSPERFAIHQQARAWQSALQRTIPALVLAPGVSRSIADCAELRVRVDFEHEVSLGRNVLAVFPGARRSGEVLVLTAHYDQAGITDLGDIVAGADDNATGVAALLAIARALFQVRHELQTSVVLAFVGAELAGGRGTGALLDDWPRLLPQTRPLACITLEALGGQGAEHLQVLGTDDGGAALQLFERVNERRLLQSGPLLLEAHAPRRLDHGLDLEPGPHLSTWALWQRADVPTWTLHHGTRPDGVADTGWQAVDTSKVTRVARLTFRATYELATTTREGALPARSPRR